VSGDERAKRWVENNMYSTSSVVPPLIGYIYAERMLHFRPDEPLEPTYRLVSFSHLLVIVQRRAARAI